MLEKKTRDFDADSSPTHGSCREEKSLGTRMVSRLWRANERILATAK